MYLYILIFVVFLYFFTNLQNKENFTQNENVLAEKIVKFFTLPNNTFIEYLLILSDNKNTSDNLISKSVYNKFKNKTGLLTDDILQEL